MKEVDLRALIYDNLKFKDENTIYPPSFLNYETDQVINRPFNAFKKWNAIEQTSYIESIFLKCDLQPIVRFVYNTHTVIVDGYNRY